MRGWCQLCCRLVLVVVVFVSGYLGARLGMVATPVAQASHNFADVPDSAFYHDNVDFLVDNQITSGCQVTPPLYCPEQSVTRGQMAVFLDRTADVVRPIKIDRPFHVFVVCAAAANNRFAVVSEGGTFVRGSAGTTASRLTTGTYVVSFDINVSGCSWQVTVGETGSVGATTGVGNVAGRSGNVNGLFITTQDVPA
jgi:hypothetical protein